MADTSRPVVFIHGLWLHSASWQSWIDHFEQAGYTATAPGWRGDSPSVKATRENADSLAGIGIQQITDAYALHLQKFPVKPIVIGHSFGGLVAQKLLGSGLAAAAVAIDPAGIKGVKKLPLAQIRTVLPVISKKSNRNRAVSVTERQFRFGFGNAISRQESRDLFNRWAIPGPALPLFEAAAAKKDPRSATAVPTNLADRGPLLITGGGKDHTVPEVVTHESFDLYAKSGAVTDYHEFVDRGHSLTIDSCWKEVADFTLTWLDRSL